MNKEQEKHKVNEVARAETITVEIAYGLADQQYLFAFDVEQGTTVDEAIAQSPLLKEIPDLNSDAVGIFSKVVKGEQVLKQGDRIEVYRPLIADPKQKRREKVEKSRAQD